MNLGVQIILQGSDLTSIGCILRSGFARSYDNSIFNILRNLHIAFCGDCTDLHSYPQCMSDPFLTFSQHLSLIFLMTAILTGVRLYLIVVLTCVSLMINVVELLFMYLWAF